MTQTLPTRNEQSDFTGGDMAELIRSKDWSRTPLSRSERGRQRCARW